MMANHSAYHTSHDHPNQSHSKENAQAHVYRFINIFIDDDNHAFIYVFKVVLKAFYI